MHTGQNGAESNDVVSSRPKSPVLNTGTMSLVDIPAFSGEWPSEHELDVGTPSCGDELFSHDNEFALRRPPRGSEFLSTFITWLLRVLVLRHALCHLDCSAFIAYVCREVSCRSSRESVLWHWSYGEACRCSIYYCRRILWIGWVTSSTKTALSDFSPYNDPQFIVFVHSSCASFTRGHRSFFEATHLCVQLRYHFIHDVVFQKKPHNDGVRFESAPMVKVVGVR